MIATFIGTQRTEQAVRDMCARKWAEKGSGPHTWVVKLLNIVYLYPMEFILRGKQFKTIHKRIENFMLQ